MNLCFDCLDLVLKSQSEGNGDSAFGGFKFLWEGNYFDHEGDTSDHAELTLDSIEVVVNKCANILREKLASSLTDSSTTNVTAKGRAILVYMPNVVQLLVSVLAAARIGAVLTFVNAAVNSRAEDLSKILEMSCAELVITVDGFFMGEELHETKKVLDEAIDLLHANNSNRIHSVLIVRHVGSNPAIPPPSKSYNGRRPHYGLEVPFIDGRDHHWSNLMVEASEQSECEWMDSEDVIFNTIKRIPEGNNDWHFEQYTVSQIALLVRMLARTIRRNRIPSLEFNRKPSCDSQHSSATFENCSKDEVSVVWAVVEMEDLLFLATFFAVPLSRQTLLLSESPPMHPNPSRIFQIVEKHGVNQLLLAEQYIKLLIRNEQFENVWYQESDPTWSITTLQVVYTVSKLRTENDNYVQWLSRCAPTARIIHFSC
ncbi:AMP-binding enzyme domain-containing protein [Ditylenchus destructor]|uniref:acetate--CoA ligase n=1 Tax=Ditylenchus destructor TaxID=166010 RepID=A0AAD4NH12_9BILA|nr:AMP-binding enzyme domain-containing protein [Ditylenchus destructor]